MMRSTDRFLTTHAGSLPRPDDLVRIMYAKEEGQAVERAELASHVRNAVAGVARQKGAGVDIINDGEMSKPSYATYVKDRLSGFGGTGNTFVYQDLVDFPNLAKRVFGDPGRSRRKTPACNGPIGFRDTEAVQIDIENLAAAIGTSERRHVHIRGVPWRDLAVLSQRLLFVRGSRTFHRNECACTYAGATTKARTTTMFPWRTSRTSFSRRGLLLSRSRPPIHVTLTNGRCSRW
jgi:hypothetical protein